jgi:hypothetical protein
MVNKRDKIALVICGVLLAGIMFFAGWHTKGLQPVEIEIEIIRNSPAPTAPMV